MGMADGPRPDPAGYLVSMVIIRQQPWDLLSFLPWSERLAGDHLAVAGGDPALKGTLGCGGILVGIRTPKLGCRQGEDKPWLVPRLDDSPDLLRARS